MAVTTLQGEAERYVHEFPEKGDEGKIRFCQPQQLSQPLECHDSFCCV
jgi:hypothetical protein